MFSDCYSGSSDSIATDGQEKDDHDEKGKQTDGGLKPARMTRNWSGTILLSLALLLSAIAILLITSALLSNNLHLSHTAVKLLLLVVHLCEALVLTLTVVKVNLLSGWPTTIVYLPLPLGAFLDSFFAEYVVPVTTLSSVVMIVLAVFYKLLCYAALASQANDKLTVLFRPFHKTYKRNGLLIKLRDFA